MTSSERVTKIVEEIEAAAYRRGWDDATAAAKLKIVAVAPDWNDPRLAACAVVDVSRIMTFKIGG